MVNSGLIVKPKMYYLEDISGDEKVKVKGLHNLKSFVQFQELLKTGEFKYMKFTKFKESLRRNLNFNQKIEVLKHLNFNDNKRLWKLENFNPEILERSEPFKILEIKEIKILY